MMPNAMRILVGAALALVLGACAPTSYVVLLDDGVPGKLTLMGPHGRPCSSKTGRARRSAAQQARRSLSARRSCSVISVRRLRPARGGRSAFCCISKPLALG